MSTAGMPGVLRVRAKNNNKHWDFFYKEGIIYVYVQNDFK